MEQNLGLISLLSEQLERLTTQFELLWKQAGEIKISASEWHVLLKIGGGCSSISEMARSANFSRQAAHRYIRALQGKGLLQSISTGSRRTRCVQLTVLGRECCQKCCQIELELESRITSRLGEEGLSSLKSLLNTEWL